MNTNVNSIEELSLTINEEIFVQAPVDVAFAALLDELGPYNAGGSGNSMPMKLEAWPGGRWFRDLGGDNGHFWGHVQAIKRPNLLEISGPLFMSYAAVSNLQYRLSEKDGGTLIKFHHSAMGFFPADHKTNVGHGWRAIHERVRSRAEAKVPAEPVRTR